jgi:uncharacterized protein YqkB
MSDRPTVIEQAEDHLKQALETDETNEKDYHIRSALQVCACDGNSGQGEFSQTD